jgi:hypothetical protein
MKVGRKTEKPPQEKLFKRDFRNLMGMGTCKTKRYDGAEAERISKHMGLLHERTNFLFI